MGFRAPGSASPDGDDTVDAKAVTEAFDRLGNSFAYTDPLL